MRTLIQIYGPLGIHSFGVALVIGLLIVSYLLQHHPLRRSFISLAQLHVLTTYSVVVAFVGGKLLFILSHPTPSSFFSAGGFSLLGSVGAVLIFLIAYSCHTATPLLPVLDIFALHAPLLQSIARIGCFLSGCCYGSSSTVFWTVMYKDPSSLAPLHLPLHPTQLYSAALLFIIYVLLDKSFCREKYFPGQLTASYFILISLERFFIDFFRGDREFYLISTLSIHQWIALLFFMGASVSLILINRISLPRTL